MLRLKLFYASIALAGLSAAMHAQSILTLPEQSQRAVVVQRIGLTDITITYHRPLAGTRKIWGGIVPYGQVWRAGANEATTFVTDTDLNVGGTAVPAGSYTIFAVPNADKWQLVISKKTGEWGTAYPGPSNDLARIDMKVSKLSSPMENFTIAFDHASSGCTLSMSWENTKASVDVSPK